MNEMTLIEVPVGTSLATIDTLVPEKVFAPGGIKAAVTALKTEVRAQAASLDISTEKGRKQIASLAYKVAQSKTALDKIGKDLTADWQRQTNLVNEDRRYLRDEMDALKDEVRKPLDEYIAEEAKRVAAHEGALADIEILAAVDGLSADQINERIWKVPAIDGRPWQEFKVRAERVIAVTLERLQGARAIAMQREEAAAQAEAERLAEIERQRQADAEAQRLREEQIARDAARAARLVAEARAELEAEEARQAAQREREAAEATAQAERDAAAQREREAAEALAQAEREKQEAEERRLQAEQRAEAARRAKLTDAIAWMNKAHERINLDWEIGHQISHIDSVLTRFAELMDEHDWQDMVDHAVAVRDVATERLTERRGKLTARQTKIEAAALAKAEAERIAAHERALARIKGMIADACSPFNDSALIQHISKLTESMSEMKRDFEEFQAQADETVAQGRQKIADRLAVVLKQEEERRQKREQEREAQAEVDRQAAVAAEQQRVAAKALADKAEADRLTKNVAHRKRIERDVLADMVEAMRAASPTGGDLNDYAKALIAALAAGKVRHTTIGYGSAA